MSRIFWIILIVCVVILGAVWYANRSRTHAVNSGEVFVHEQPAAKTQSDGAAPETAAQTPSSESGQTAQSPEPVAAQADGGVVAPPASDSISRNPPNGMIFAGRGKYQLYRQGDITWRLNTDTGQACILFATDAEWRKARVFQQGCGGS